MKRSKPIYILPTLSLNGKELVIKHIYSGGPGGQNVNKVATGIHLSFNVRTSLCLTEAQKALILSRADSRISKSGVINIKSTQMRTQNANILSAEQRLATLIRSSLAVRAVRKPTRPSRNSIRKRRDQKLRKSQIKALRKSPRL